MLSRSKATLQEKLLYLSSYFFCCKHLGGAGASGRGGEGGGVRAQAGYTAITSLDKYITSSLKVNIETKSENQHF